MDTEDEDSTFLINVTILRLHLPEDFSVNFHLCEFWFLCTEVLCCVDFNRVCEDLLPSSAFTYELGVGEHLGLQISVL